MNNIKYSFNKLKNYCEKEQFKGWDPYDGLNSPIIQYTPLKYSSFIRLVWIQVFKKNPINLRPLFGIKKDYNPKGVALFVSAYSNLYKIEPKEEYLKTIVKLADKLLELKTQGYSGDCWGYNFDWQSRLEFKPNKTPTVVVTSFVGYALMDAYDCTNNERYLNSALSSCNFVLKDLNRTPKKQGFVFSYSPLDKMSVYNASFLGSKLLSRAYSYSKNPELIEMARQSVIACTSVQREDGAWIFGLDPVQNWVDSFHTGYKLESLSEYMKYSGDNSFQENLTKGLKYYLENFILEDGTPKYYNNKTLPIDIHCPAQFIVTLSRLDVLKENKEKIDKMLTWTINNMQDKKGYFYYQIMKVAKAKIPYMRWGQAWMFYGMSFYLLELKRK